MIGKLTGIDVSEVRLGPATCLQNLRNGTLESQLHHFTRLDQVTQLVRTSEAEADVGFMARLLALCSLPRTNPGDRKEFIRRNGPYTLGMVAGVGNKLPYGTLPRLLLAWVRTEAVRTGRRELYLGRGLRTPQVCKKLGISEQTYYRWRAAGGSP